MRNARGHRWLRSSCQSVFRQTVCNNSSIEGEKVVKRRMGVGRSIRSIAHLYHWPTSTLFSPFAGQSSERCTAGEYLCTRMRCVGRFFCPPTETSLTHCPRRTLGLRLQGPHNRYTAVQVVQGNVCLTRGHDEKREGPRENGYRASALPRPRIAAYPALADLKVAIDD